MGSWEIVAGNKAATSLSDVQSLLSWLSEHAVLNNAGKLDIFQWDKELHISRAPGRLDVMGGIAVRSHKMLRITSQLRAYDAKERSFEMGMEELFPQGEPITYSAAHALLKKDPKASWAGYVAGCVLVASRELGLPLGHESISILVVSDVPEGKGISSSAALEVATMSALLAAHGVQLPGRQLAIICQKVENLVVGAPCGIMDQMSSALGEPNKLLALLCQPAEVQGSVAIPGHLRFWGIDSGLRHSVGGSDYGAVRVGAFMGLRILSNHEHCKASNGAMQQAAAVPMRNGHLVNITPSEYVEAYEHCLPETITGREFLEKHRSHFDSVTSINPDQEYAVRVPTQHPIYEHFRVQAFRLALQLPANTAHQGEILGELMFQSHASYSRCGLGSTGTDRLVQLVREEIAAARAAGQEPALYGAKITGGGCGGTVCVLGQSGPEAQQAVDRVVSKYSQEMGYMPAVFAGSSLGAVDFGHIAVKLSP